MAGYNQGFIDVGGAIGQGLDRFYGARDRMQRNALLEQQQARQAEIDQGNALAFQQSQDALAQQMQQQNALQSYGNQLMSGYGQEQPGTVGPMPTGGMPLTDRASAIQQAGQSGVGMAGMGLVNQLYPDPTKLTGQATPTDIDDFVKDAELAKQGDQAAAMRNAARMQFKRAQAPEAAGIRQAVQDVNLMTQPKIAEATKFAEMQGSQRSQVIDKSFDKVMKLDKNIGNIDDAIKAVQSGAGTGAIKKLLPSMRETSVLLDQVQGQLALDVIGSVTFGALSEGELNLAKSIAIPTGLQGEPLVEWLQAKKTAQKKLMDYYKEQIDFLDKGGSVAGFLRSKERQVGQQSPQGQASTQSQQATQQQVIRFDAQGNIIQ